MFEDIYNFEKNKRKVDLHDYRSFPRCVKCGSINFKNLKGVFISRTKLKETMKCNDCGARWHVILDKSLRIVKVEKKYEM